MSHIELFRTRYDEEWAKLAALQQSTSATTGLLTLMGTGLAVLVQRGLTPALPNPFVFWLAMLASVVAWLVAAYHLLRSMVRQTYTAAAPAQEWRAYQRKLDEAATTHGLPQGKADQEFEGLVCDAYAEAAAENWSTNLERGRLLSVANLAFIVAVLMAGIAVVPLAVAMKQQQAEIHEVRVVNFSEMTNERRQRADGPSRAATTSGVRSRASTGGSAEGDSSAKESKIHNRNKDSRPTARP